MLPQWECSHRKNALTVEMLPTERMLKVGAAGDGLGGGSGGGEALLDFCLYSRSDIGVAAGEDVDGCVSMFWPRVHGDVAFGDDDYSGKSMGTELVEDGFDHGGAGGVGRIDECGL